MWNSVSAIIAIALVCGASGAVPIKSVQELPFLALKIATSTHFAHASETIEIQITLQNTSKSSYYVCGSINVSISSAVCTYDLEVRPIGSEFYKTTTKIAVDAFQVYGRFPSAAEFIAENNIVLLEPNQFVGKRLSGTWRGLTVMPPGKYEIRAVYRGSKKIPVMLERPFFADGLVSNVVVVEVLP